MTINKKRLKRIIKEEMQKTLREYGRPTPEDPAYAPNPARHKEKYAEPSTAGLVHHLNNAYNIVYAIAGELAEGPFPNVEDANVARTSYMESLYKAAKILESLKSRIEGNDP